MYWDKVLYKGNRPLSEKRCRFENILPSHTVCCTLTIRYITYSMVERSIVDISDLRRRGKYATEVGYRVYGPTYHMTYIRYMVW